jgi:Flp pilus assembly pilin Flp
MSGLLRRLWADDRGAVISTELVLILAILIFGILAGFVALRNSVIAALGTTGNTLTTLVPSFTFSGFAIGRAFGGHTIAQIQGYELDPATTILLTGYQLTPIPLGTIAVIPPAP